LLDGNYLDKSKSKDLTAELLTHNADLRVLGYSKLTFTWQRDGAIQGAPLAWHLCQFVAVCAAG